MQRHSILLAGLPVLVVLMVFTLALPAAAQNKFENKDTAVNRQDNTWGTRKKDETYGGYHTTTEDGDASWGNRPAPQEEPKDWSEDMVIVVEPDVGYGEKTVETTTRDADGNTTGSTTTTTTY